MRVGPYCVRVCPYCLLPHKAEDGSRCIKSCDYHVILSGDTRNAATPTPARLSRIYSIFGSPSTVDRAKGMYI